LNTANIEATKLP